MTVKEVVVHVHVHVRLSNRGIWRKHECEWEVVVESFASVIAVTADILEKSWIIGVPP